MRKKLSSSNSFKNYIHSKEFTNFIVAFLISLVFLFLGIFGIVKSSNAAKEYNSSADIKEVPAVVTYVEYKNERNEEEKIISEYWMATFTYTVDGKEYKGKQKFNQMVSKGDTFNIEVYKNSKGDYKIYKKTGVLGYVLYYVSLIVGAVLFVASVVSLIPKKNGKKKQKLESR